VSLWRELVGLLPFAWAQFAFMQNALLAVLLVTPLFALLGCLVISNQMAFFSEAVGHATLTGLAIGALLGLADPTAAMVGFAVLLAAAVTALRGRSGVSTDTLIGLVMAFAVALGVVLLSRGGGFARYSRYLVGDLLTVAPGEIARLAAVLAAVVAVWLAFFNRFLLAALNPALAGTRGVSVRGAELLFACVVAVAVAVSIPWVGLLVVNSLLIIPAAAARALAANTRQYVLLGVLFSTAAGVAGLVLSFRWGTATGATIALVALAFYAVALLLRRRGGAG
jgi:zinc transport system permease protein